jgi:sugar phosphate isomerase/epimerase
MATLSANEHTFSFTAGAQTMVSLSCASLSAEGFGDSGFEKTFSMIPQAGYSYIEFNLWAGRMLLPQSLDDIKEKCAQHAMKASSVYCTDLGGQPSRIDIDVAHKLYGMLAAQRLGCTKVVMSGAANNGGGTLEAACTTLSLIAPVYAQNGIEICLENHNEFTIDTIDDYKKIFEKVPADNIGICIDTGHFDASKVDMDLLIDVLADRVNHIHIKENREWGIKGFCRFGEGTTRNAHVIERMLEHGYEGFIVVEQSPTYDRDISVDDLKKPVTMFKHYERQG